MTAFPPLLERIIAKSDRQGRYLWLPLLTHLTDTEQIALRLWDHWVSPGVKERIARSCGGEASARQFLGLAALTHDVGKASRSFQAQILDGMRHANADAAQAAANRLCEALPEGLGTIVSPVSHHSVISEWLAERYLGQRNRGLASVLGAHHGRACTSVDWENVKEQQVIGVKTPQWPAAQKALFDWALARSGYADAEQIPRPDQPSLVLLTGLLIVADWLASSESLFPYIPLTELHPAASPAARAEAAWASIALPEPWQSDADALEDAAWLFDAARYGFDTPNAMQTAMLEHIVQAEKPGIFILEAAMGTGKTEAALASAELLCAKCHRSGIFFALPTQATSNGIFPRLQRWANVICREDGATHTIRLVHGSAHLNTAYRSCFDRPANPGDASVHAWFEGRKKSLLSDFIVGTMDQLLMSTLNARHVMLRHLGLAGKVVIIDECHAYDTFMNQYLERALTWLASYGVPVIILSATLPASRRDALIRAYAGAHATLPSAMLATMEYPLLTWSDGPEIHQAALPSDQTQRQVAVESLDEHRLDSVIAGIMSKGGCLGIVMNTVKAAQALAERLAAAYPDADVRLLHARFVMADRIRREEALLASLGKKGDRPEKCIIIGTQVIEQSLDVDFDCMISELCPMDLLLQRIGRLHRHDRQRPVHLQLPKCYVLGAREPLSEANQAVYEPWLLLQTQAALPERITLPADIPALVQQVYGAQGDASEAWATYSFRQEDQAARARVFLLKKTSRPQRPGCLDDWQVITASDDERACEAAVRDATATLEVLALQHTPDDHWRFLGDGVSVPDLLDSSAAAQIAGQRLRLPTALCAKHRNAACPSEDIIKTLECQTGDLVPHWQQSPLLKGELLLAFDENGDAQLNGYHLHYSPLLGLQYETEGAHG